MSTYDYSSAEFPNFNVGIYTRKALAAGYSHPVWGGGDTAQYPLRLTVDQEVDRTVLRDDVSAAVEPMLQVSTDSLGVPGDGTSTSTIVVTDTRGAAAAGRTVNLIVLGGPLVASPGSVVLDAAGQATFTFGPSWSANVHSGPIGVEFRLADSTARPVRSFVHFTG